MDECFEVGIIEKIVMVIIVKYFECYFIYFVDEVSFSVVNICYLL